MKVGIAYATPQRQVWLTLDAPDGATVREVIEKSGVLSQFPDINLETQKVGIYGKATQLDAQVEPGSRIEIYRPITADPKTVKRRPKPEGKAEAEAGDD